MSNVTISLPDLRVVSMDYDALVQRIKKSTSVTEAIKRGQVPVIVVKAYLATPTISITRAAAASAELSGRLKDGVKASAGASAGESGQTIYKAESPIIFAFETSQIEFDPADFGRGVLTVRLASLPSSVYLARQEIADGVIADVEFAHQNAAEIRKVGSSSEAVVKQAGSAVEKAVRDIGRALGVGF
jgi:hypothetical protein